MNDRRLSSIWLIGAAIPAGLLFVPSTVADPQVKSWSGPILTIDGHRFRDLDRNGRVDTYEDWRLSPEQRTDDLIARMTFAEKAGTILQVSLPITYSGTEAGPGKSANGYDLVRVAAMIRRRGITSFVSRLSLPPRRLAEQNNAVQAIGETARLGIPITIITHPIVASVSAASLTDATIDLSVRPMMIAKFAGGLFENPYVDPVAAEGPAASRAAVVNG